MAAPAAVRAALLLCLAGACNPRAGQEGDIALSPAETTVQTGGEQKSARFTARSAGGEDVSAGCAWSVDDAGLGSAPGGLFTTAPGLDHGGVTQVRCTIGQRAGAATVRVQLVGPDLVEAGAPDDAADAFAGPPGGPAPEVVYPLPGAMLARNIAQMRLAWRADASHKLHRVVLESPTYQQTIYLGARACSDVQCSYRVPDEDWGRAARAASGGAFTLTISAVAAPGGAVGRSGSLTLNISPEDVKGGLYYFATTRFGLMRLPFGGQRPVPFLTGLGTADPGVNRCIGCHAVSRDGKKIAAVWSSGDGYAGIVDGADPKRVLLQPQVAPEGQLWNFASFNPAGDRLVGVWRGELSLRDGGSGALIAKIPSSKLGGGRAAMPEWSPDGKWVVFVRIAEPEGRLGVDMAVDRTVLPAGDWILGDAGDIAIIPYDNGAFGDAVTVVPRQRDREYHFYPSFTPDSRWIVFNSARRDRCKSAAAGRNGIDNSAGCVTYDQQGARLRIVRAEAGAAPIELAAATHLPDKTTAWPKVAPFQQAGGKLIFVSFSAKFDYGWVVQQSEVKRTTGAERPQLWMSAIDLGKAEAGGADPSYPPFWLPFQDAGTNNHEVIWTTDIACKQANDCGEEFGCINGVCVPRLG